MTSTKMMSKLPPYVDESSAVVVAEQHEPELAVGPDHRHRPRVRVPLQPIGRDLGRHQPLLEHRDRLVRASRRLGPGRKRLVLGDGLETKKTETTSETARPPTPPAPAEGIDVSALVQIPSAIDPRQKCARCCTGGRFSPF